MTTKFTVSVPSDQLDSVMVGIFHGGSNTFPDMRWVREELIRPGESKELLVWAGQSVRIVHIGGK